MRFDDLRFTQIEDIDDWQQASMGRGIFKDCEVRLLIWEDGQYFEYSDDEISVPGPVKVMAFCETTGKIVDHHRAAFEHFMENIDAYEERLMAYLLDVSNRNAELAIEAAESAELRAVIGNHVSRGVDALKEQIAWTELGLYDHGWDGVGFVTLDFECGWDEEHGISILMHKGQVIAHGGMGEFTCRGDSLIGHAKCAQECTTGYDIKLP